MAYEYNATVKKIIDGDTIVVDIDLGFNVVLGNQTVRLLGVDAPESKTSNRIEKIFGILAKDEVKNFLDECKNSVIIQTYLEEGDDKFGRILAQVYDPKNKLSLNDHLVSEGYAVAYSGKNKSLIQNSHIDNRRKLIDSGKIKMSYSEAGLI